MIYVFRDLDKVTADDIEHYMTFLSPQRQEKAMSYRHELGRKQCVLAYITLRHALSKEYGIRTAPVFTIRSHGKPELADHIGIHFSLSHCRTAVACAVSGHLIGVDIENVRPAKEAVIKYSMNEDETNQILSSDNPDLEFTKLWTRKECLVKLTGEGINDDMKNLLDSARNSIHVNTRCLDNEVVLSIATPAEHILTSDINIVSDFFL